MCTVDPNYLNKHGQNVLMCYFECCCNINPEVVRHFLDQTKLRINQVMKVTGVTALIEACSNKYVPPSVITMLVRKGADVNHVDAEY